MNGRVPSVLPPYEVVANVSEGRDASILAAFTSVVAGSPGVHLLDDHHDADHDRSVYTYVGEADALILATRALARLAVATINLASPAKSGAGRGGSGRKRTDQPCHR